MFNTDSYETRIQQALQHFEDEIKKLRTGRANPSMLSGVIAEVYGGTRMPLNQIATITSPEPQLLQVAPFDPANLQAVVVAIRDNQLLDLNPSDDGRVVRIPIPPLNAERRQAIVKQLSEKVEECRIAIRSVRHDALKDAKQGEKDKQISKDDYARIEKAMDDIVAKSQKTLDEKMKAKEAEIMTV
ncbi:MAG TPA: ribosome recycling factor [Candidatus Saccharimonadales bacterium]|nr:ribosome recycling factor [Candidatus Saccharimonadales bacterium]